MRDDIQLAGNGWELLRAGMHREGIELLKEAHKVCPTDMHKVGLSAAYLFIRDYGAACQYLDALNEARPRHMDKYYQLAGVARWLMGNPLDAARVWLSGVHCQYTDGAGGVTTPLLLVFAASRCPDSFKMMLARTLLKEALNRSWAKNWPGHIGRYMMGEIDEMQLRRSCNGYHELDTRTRGLMADFYVAVLRLSDRNIPLFASAMTKYVADLCKVDPAGKEWNCEYHLAKYEIQA